MDKLPHEVVYQIVGDLKQIVHSLAPYTPISRVWQQAIERITFQWLSVSSLELDLFSSIYQGQRRQILFELTFYPVPLIEIHSNRPEVVEDVKQQTSQAISRLFEILHEPEDTEACFDGGLYLTIVPPRVFRRTDVMFMNARPGRLTNRMMQNITSERNCQNLSTLNIVPLNSDKCLSTANHVTGLEVFWLRGVEYDPVAIAGMIRSCPRLQNLEWLYLKPREREAYDSWARRLVSSLHSLEIPQADTIEFGINRRFITTCIDDAPNLSSPDLDAMRTAWKKFSSFDRLSFLVLDGIFGPRSFESCSWPNLQQCEIRFRIPSVDGQRHFLHNASCHCGQDDDEENEEDLERAEYRANSDESSSDQSLILDHYNIPNPATIPAMIVSLLTAIDNMPRLKRLTFKNTEISGICSLSEFRMEYNSTGSIARRGDDSPEDILQRRVYFSVGDWRASDAGTEGEKIIQTLGELGMQHKYLDRYKPT